MVSLRAVRGMNDLFAADLETWHRIERSVAKLFPLYGFQEIRTPIVEELALFKRGVGENTDIVEKEMFLVPDGEHSYCLRPENTASVVRALIERGGLSVDSQEKLYYLGPMFRKERPQKGRLRQFHQFGVESFGVSEASADIEIIALVDHLFSSLGLNLSLKINSLGSNQERGEFRLMLKNYLSNQEAQLCEDCRRRLELNILRVLDCKNANCKAIVAHAPGSLDSLGEESRKHFEQVQQGLSDIGISFLVEPHLVRGLDYYNRTVFEFVANIGLGAQNTVAGGGRYDGLFVTLGHHSDLPAIGCAGGIERIILLLAEQAQKLPPAQIISLLGADTLGHETARRLAYQLRKAGFGADFSLVPKSVKAQMRRADKLGVLWVTVIGEQEVKTGKIILKSMINEDKKEVTINADSIIQAISSTR